MPTVWAESLYFTCSLKSDPDTKVNVTVNAEEFNDPDNYLDINASFELIRGGKVVKSAVNGVVGERLPVTVMPGYATPLWALRLEAGRSGYLAMGFNPVTETWDLKVSMIEMPISSGADNAICSAVDSSGMSH